MDEQITHAEQRACRTKAILDSILSLRESRELGRSVPYNYTLGAEGRKVFVLGMAHFKPAEDPQFTLTLNTRSPSPNVVRRF